MGLEVGTFLDDLVTSNPVGATDDTNKGDDHLRLIKSVLKATFPNATKAFRFESVLTKTTTYSVVAADARALILGDASSGAFTITLPLGSTVFAGYTILIMKSESSSNDVIVDGNGAETINGSLTRSLTNQYQGEKYTWDGSEWKVIAVNGLADNSVTFAKMQNITTARLLGRTTAGSGDTEEISVDSTMDLSSLTLGVADTGIDTTQLAASAVETAKINDLAVTTGKIADNAVTLAKQEHGTAGDILYYGASGVPSRLAKGSDNEVLTLASGIPSWAVGSGGQVALTVFTASGTWTPHADATSALIFCTGGGGGGGDSTNNSAAGGGGGGATAIDFVADSTGISSETVTIGSGGIGDTTGAAGGTSSVGSLASAGGGAGGKSLNTTRTQSVLGGTATVGDMLISGGGGTGGTGAIELGGAGGGTFWGGGPGGGFGAGDDGAAFGTGGSGAGDAGDGGDGQDGAVLILEW